MTRPSFQMSVYITENPADLTYRYDGSGDDLSIRVLDRLTQFLRTLRDEVLSQAPPSPDGKAEAESRGDAE